MVSTTHCSTRTSRPRRASLCCGLLLLLMPLALIGDEPDPFSVRSVEVERTEQEYRLHSVVDFDLNPTVLEALHNGVSLTLVTQLRLYRQRRWLWDEEVSDITRRFRLRYFALSQLYLLTDLDDTSHHSFLSLGAALYHLGHMETTLAQRHQVLTGQPHYLRLRLFLDIDALPAPLRPLAYLSSRWKLKSKWQQWTIEL